MNDCKERRRSDQPALLVTVLSTAMGIAACGGGGDIVCLDGTQLNADQTGCVPIESECPTGQMLDPDSGTCVLDCAVGQQPNTDATACEPIICETGYMFDTTTNSCIAIPDACASADPCSPKPTGADAVSKVTLGNACVCVATSCLTGYLLDEGGLGVCVADAQCGPGFRQEGNVCIPREDVTCVEAPDSPLCIPVLCAEVVDFAALGNDENGNPWTAESFKAAGKCIDAAPAPVESCESGCHNGIENPHPWFQSADLSCTGCHGGDAAATTREAAHVAIPSEWQAGSTQVGRPNLRYYWNYNTLFGVENFQGGLEWLRFRNPSDLRVAEQSCGKAAGCHQDRVENVRRSVMATESGLVGVSQGRNGIARTVNRGNDGLYKFDATSGFSYRDGDIQARVQNDNYIGSVARMTKFTIQNREYNGAYDQIDLLREVYDKQCGDCHLNNAGANNRYADFRTSGCGSCHMTYALDGRSRSSDPMIPKTEPTYPAAYAQIANFDPNDLQNLNGAWLGPERAHPTKHRLTRQMSSQRCGTCHVGSNRTDWQFRGYQIDPNRTAVTALNGGFIDADQVQFTDEIDNDANPFARYHGQAQDQVLKYIDWNNDGIDDIPADVHYTAGLECMDCHTGAEMHNELKFVKQAKVTDWNDPAQVDDMSGALWSHMDQSTEIECVHCHGNLEYRALSYEIDNRNPIKNLIVCPEAGETIQGYTPPAECDTLSAGRWLRSKFTGRYHYVTQTADTVNNVGSGAGGGITDPSGAEVYTLNASIFHGRYNNDITDGAGPCPNGDINNCYRDQANNQYPVTQGFSHLGDEATSPVDQHAGGLECYSCHATWANNCFGCHLRLVDTDGNNILRDFSRSTGELTYGFIAEADFTYIAPLEMQYGINSEGKISQFLPETKQMVAHTDANNNEYFGTQVIVNNDANIEYNVYRDRAGFGLRQYATEQVGLPPNADGPLYEQDARMDNNAGQGAQQMMPHSVQRSHPLMDCTNCHLDVNAANTTEVRARFMAQNTGFGNISDYLAVLANTGITRNNSNEDVVVDAAAGFRFDANIDPEGFSVNQQSDWCVLYEANDLSAYPLCYNNHPMKQGTYGIGFDPQYARSVPTLAPVAGPLNTFLLDKMFNQIKVADENVQLRTGRR